MITVNGKSYAASDFENGGHVEQITAGTGDELPRFLACIADMLADASRARFTTSATSKNGGLSGAQSWVLAEDISFAAGAYFTVASRSTPTVNYVMQATGYVGATKTLTGTVVASGGSGGPYTDWDVMVSGKPGVSLASGHGQCRLAKSGANLVLSPFNGNYLNINGSYEVVPAAGVSLAATGLTPSTLYYIYAYMSGGSMALEASATAPATDTTTGVLIKTGDASRTLVGMARPVTGPAWQDSAAQRFVLSHFNRRPIEVGAAFTAGRSRSTGTYDELNSEIRNEFLTWADSAVDIAACGRATITTSGEGFSTTLGIDGTTAEDVHAGGSAAGAGQILPFALGLKKTLAVGYHYATLLGLAGAGGVTWEGNASATSPRCTLKTTVMG